MPLRLLGDGAAIETARRRTSKLFDVAAAAAVVLFLLLSLMMIRDLMRIIITISCNCVQ